VSRPAALWPASLWVVRHGESAGNVARDIAEANAAPMIDIAARDMDLPLSDLGERQAVGLGRWMRGRPARELPEVVVCSPYERARRTAELIIDSAGLPIEPSEVQLDERLREREFGILDRLTRAGIQQRYPEQAAARGLLGKFYHRPPGGESWADVALRLRSMLDSLSRQYPGERVLVVTHQVVVLVLRYLLEQLDEATLLAIDRDAEIANCSVTVFEHDPKGRRGHEMPLRTWNDVTPLRRAEEPITREPDARVAPR
jgi:broad specificity phosphatase PhoE